LLLVFAAVFAVWCQDALSWWNAHQEAGRQAAIVRRLQRANAALLAQQRSLNDPATIIREARALGMVRSGEHAYVVTGLPNR
jgi:cell division protein FtsB